MPNPPRTILFAGGGTGGHIYPNLAIYEQLRQLKAATNSTATSTDSTSPQLGHFLVSNREVDARIMSKEGIPFTALPARPVSAHPLKLAGFLKAFLSSQKRVAQLIKQLNVGAMVTTGGFVSAPAAAAASRLKIPIVMVNLDAVPGKANRWIAKRATELYTAYPHKLLENATVIGLPLRQNAIGPADKSVAIKALHMNPDKPMLLVTGASQGATSINEMMLELSRMASPKRALQDWQILHLAGKDDADAVRKGYQEAGLDAQVQVFCDQMGMAWRGATLAISRCGAGSVAEVWANSVPTFFLPYPFHKDEHQRLNAQMLADAGASQLMKDLVEPVANARQIAGPLLELMGNAARRQKMIELLEHDRPPQGAQTIASWLVKMV